MMSRRIPGMAREWERGAHLPRMNHHMRIQLGTHRDDTPAPAEPHARDALVPPRLELADHALHAMGGAVIVPRTRFERRFLGRLVGQRLLVEGDQVDRRRAEEVGDVDVERAAGEQVGACVLATGDEANGSP